MQPSLSLYLIHPSRFPLLPHLATYRRLALCGHDINALNAIDRPLTDLYKTEEDGGFPGPNFFARPVVGGHFAFLTLGRACGGKAMEGLSFLDAKDTGGRAAAMKAVAEWAHTYGDEL